MSRAASSTAPTSRPETVRLERPAEGHGRVAVLTLDRPPLNVLGLPTLEALDTTLGEVEDDASLQLLVVRGAGPRAFSAGVAVEDHVAERVGPMLDTFHRALLRLRRLPAVSLAVVHGHCLGGGLELAMACDLRLATDDARFGQPEIDVGCYPPFAAALYPRLLGPSLAAELILTGRILDAAEAEAAGLVSWRVPAGELEDRLGEVIARLTAKSAAVTRPAVAALRAGRDLPFAEALAESERLYREELVGTADMSEGLGAFLEKRSPRWRHR